MRVAISAYKNTNRKILERTQADLGCNRKLHGKLDGNKFLFNLSLSSLQSI